MAPTRRTARTLASLVLAAAVPWAILVAASDATPASAAGRAPALEPAAAALVPHRAVYRMSLASARSGSGLSGAKGLMLYRFADACDHWAVETNIYLELRYAEGPDARIAWSFAALEAKDGSSYRFRLRHERDGKPVESLKGTARIDAAGGAGTASFEDSGPSKPPQTMDLAAGTLFPTRHLVAVLAAARAGERFLPKTVFDGASLDNPYRVTATIGAARQEAGQEARQEAGSAAGAKGKEQQAPNAPGPLGKLLDAAGLEAGPAWPVRLAFFPARSRRPEPEFEIGVDYRADGIAERVEQDYGEFVIDMAPAEFEVLARPEC
ncbi:MAG: EipB family protein [Rhodospirillales bacterium]